MNDPSTDITPIINITVSEHDFNVADEYQAIINNNPTDGAVVFFVGLVRDFNQGKHIQQLTLEHYPAMVERSLKNIVGQASARWQLGRVRLIHRVGELQVNDQIVLVAVSSKHRQNSFDAAQFIMDFLKTEAPFWKKEKTNDGEHWVVDNEKDHKARKRW